MMKGKVEEAKQVLCRAAHVNKKTIPFDLLDKVGGSGPAWGQAGGCGRASSLLILSSGTLAQKVSSAHGLRKVTAKSNPARGRPEAGLTLWGQTGFVGPIGVESKLGSLPCLWLVLFVL